MESNFLNLQVLIPAVAIGVIVIAIQLAILIGIIKAGVRRGIKAALQDYEIWPDNVKRLNNWLSRQYLRQQDADYQRTKRNERGNRTSDSLNKNGKAVPEARGEQWNCPNCKAVNPGNTYKCGECGYSLV